MDIAIPRENLIELDGTPLIGKVSAVLSAGSTPSSFYKIVLEAPYNTVNGWLIVK
jgi:hypothetical protein